MALRGKLLQLRGEVLLDKEAMKGGQVLGEGRSEETSQQMIHELEKRRECDPVPSMHSVIQNNLLQNKPLLVIDLLLETDAK